jgi:hypothetical protein
MNATERREGTSTPPVDTVTMRAIVAPVLG